jgi:SAM-dependent methyltransferase
LEKQKEISWVEFREGDATKLPLYDEQWDSFDVGHVRFVLEHLSKPETAVKELCRAVKPGGRIVIADDDHISFLLNPDPPGFSTIWNAYMRSYDRLGNDPYIGRRLVSLLYDCGLRKIKNDVVFFGDCSGSPTFESYVNNLIGILESARTTMLEGNLISERVMNEAISNLQRWAMLPYAALWYQIYWAEGVKVK